MIGVGLLKASRGLSPVRLSQASDIRTYTAGSSSGPDRTPPDPVVPDKRARTWPEADIFDSYRASVF